MALEDKDFMLRQVKQLAEGLGALLSKKSIKELLNYEQSEGDLLTDGELDAIILLVDVQQKARRLQLTEAQTAEKIGLPLADWQAISNSERFPTTAETSALTGFLQQN